MLDYSSPVRAENPVSRYLWLILLSFLPETLRALVGDGSAIPKSIVYRPVINVTSRTTQSSQAVSQRGPIRFRNPFHLLRQPDIFLLLFFNGIIIAVFFGVVASISTIFHDTYPFLNETELGLCFLSIGGGTIIGSTVTGKLLDWDFQRIRKNLQEISEKDGQTFRDDQFPIEKARNSQYVCMCSCWSRHAFGSCPSSW